MQKLCARSGYLVILLFGAAFWPLAKFIPVPSPTMTPVEVAAMYAHNTNGIRFGMLLMSISGAIFAPFVAVIAIQMKRIEGASPILTYTQLCSGSIGALFFIIPALIFGAAAYRPDRPPELTSLLNDLAWFFAVMPVAAAFMQNVSIALAIFSDQRAEPVFPRWLGYFNIWVALLFAPGGLITFFKTGPFAWNGLLAFYVAGVVFAAWFFVMVTMLLKAIDQQAREAA
jgi:hypothetical protein